MVKFNQIIKPGERGGDVKAVKDGMVRMGVPGSGAMSKTNRDGPATVKCIQHVQRHHNIHVDGIYGPATHEIIAQHFSHWDNLIYARAKKRHHKHPPTPAGDAVAAAKKLVQFHNEGKFHDDSGRIMAQINLAALGKPVWSPAGRYVHLDQRMLKGLVWLVEAGYRIGCYAMCSDHPYDGGMLGHSGGRAVDISSVNGVSVSSHTAQARENTLKAVVSMHHMPTSISPWQLICDGYGYQHDGAIAAQTIPNAAFYGYSTMSMHRNHFHYGV